MKAILVREFGGPEVLKLEEVPTPKPAAGQVLVRIHAAGVNPYDTYMRAGNYAVKPQLPYTPGSDGAGVVEAVGDGVKKVKPGDRVYTAKTVTGAYAQYALALEEQVHALRITRCITRRKRTLPRPSLCMAPAAAWAAPACKWRVPWGSLFSVLRERRRASTWSSAKAPIMFSITAKRVIRKKS